MRTEIKVNGREARIILPKEKGKDLIGMFIKVDSLNKFSIYGRSKDEHEQTILSIFGSVKFE